MFNFYTSPGVVLSDDDIQTVLGFSGLGRERETRSSLLTKRLADTQFFLSVTYNTFAVFTFPLFRGAAQQ